MNANLFLKGWSLPLAASVVLSAASSAACTGFYVGRKVSADGTTLLARTVDAVSPSSCKALEVFPRIENRPGRYYLASDSGAQWPLPVTTWHAVTVPAASWMDGHGRYEGACANEKGVMLTGTVTAYANEAARKADPYVKEGFSEASLPGLLIVSASTAREAVELLGRVVAERGHNGSEIYMVADAAEAWYVEVYTGHQWAAVRLPEDRMLAIGNQFLLREFDPSAPGSLSSEGLVATAEKGGFLKRGRGGLIDLAATYSPAPAESGSRRTWALRRRFAPSEAGDYTQPRLLPLLFAPERRVSVRDLQEATRWRYEGIGLCPEETGDQSIRVVGVGRQNSCHVLSLDASLPPERRCTMWVTLANAEHAPYLPLNAVVTSVPADFSMFAPGSSKTFNPALPAAHFRRLAALAEVDRRKYGDGVRAYWRKLEDRWIEEFAKVVRDGDATAVTAWCAAAHRTALADAKRIFDELTWYICQQNFTDGDYVDPGMRPVRRAFVPGCASH